MPDSQVACSVKDPGVQEACGEAAREVVLVYPSEAVVAGPDMATWSVYTLCGRTGHDARQLMRLVRAHDPGAVILFSPLSTLGVYP